MKIPSNEKLWLTITSESNKTYIVTSNKDRSTYFLYLVNEDKLEKVGKGKNPPEVEKLIK